MKQYFINISSMFFFFILASSSASDWTSYKNPSGMEVPCTSNIQQTSPVENNMFYTFGVGTITDSLARKFKSLGVTSIESYVTWESVNNKGEGQWDWSEWDNTVRVLKNNDLKWVPFLILGPAYSTPDWFRSSGDHYPCRCLEHELDNMVESRWNPHLTKWIYRFIEAFAERYEDSDVIESVLLGIQGDFGEAIYSVTGGGWTFQIPGVYHNHQGFWCGDPYALADFIRFMQIQYYSINQLNKAWGTEFENFNEIDFPGRKVELEAFRKLVVSGNPNARRRWLDFVDWYRTAMTEWADWWIKTTRTYFPDTPIYLCTGGDAIPEHGSNFAEQARVAAKYDAGLRITNEGSDYATNFSLTRWVASACKHYGTYFGFEPAGYENEKGIIARIYNATASGANQLHDYSNNITQSQSRINVQQDHIKYLFHVNEPIVPVALWYPNVAMTIQWGGYLQKAAQFRDYIDFDYIDESMLRTRALNNKKILVIAHGEIMELSDAKIIAQWVQNGGRVIIMNVKAFESVEGTQEPEHILFGETMANEHTLGKGKIERVTGWNSLCTSLQTTLEKLNLPVCDLKKDGIYTTQIGINTWLFLNTNDKSSIVRIKSQGGTRDVTIEAGTITKIEIK